MAEPSQEEALPRAAKLLHEASYVMALTGAGISIKSGIPPFRGPGGLWTKYGEPPMNGYEIFLRDPKKAWEERLSPTGPSQILKETIAKAEPNPGHYAFVNLEQMGLLGCLITQNVDNLHRRAGSQNLAEIHGNSTLVRCIRCNLRRPVDDVSLEELPPPCPNPLCNGILKVDTVAFGEPIPPDVLEQCQEETNRCDCMIVVGTSATVYPAAYFPIQVRDSGGVLIEVNPYASELSPFCDISLRGESDVVMPQLVELVKALRM